MFCKVLLESVESELSLVSGCWFWLMLMLF
jgi:hypothetical protein